MTYQDIAQQVEQLPLDQQLMLLEELTRKLRMALVLKAGPQKAETLLRRGMLKTSDPLPTDEEIEEAYTDYLIEKYR